MTTEQNIPGADPVAGDPTPIEDEPKDANAELRAYAAGLKEENEILREGAIGGALAEIGLKATEGLGLAIAEGYDGVITTENVAAYAEEKYKHKAENAPVPPAVVTGERLETLDASSSPVTPPPETDPAREATDKMHDPTTGRDEAVASINAKMGQFQREHYP